MRKTLAMTVWVGLAWMAVPVWAHHSWTADYDGGKPVNVTGVVSKVEWTNPHTHFYVDVKSSDGTVKTWNFEMASTLSLERGGWTRKTLPVGTGVTVTGFGGRQVTERAIAGSITTSDGKALFVGKPGQ
jgi:hypothetical protein